MRAPERARLLATLAARFDAHPRRHAGIAWVEVQARLEAAPEAALHTLAAMEASGGEPDVIGRESAGALVFCDCAGESPAGRRSLCYDEAALQARKENRPAGSALAMAAVIGVELLSEAQYRELQQLGDFDLKTSSWVKTPPAIRRLGGALFCDRRYDQVFCYHNGAQSYYAARGFRGRVEI